MWGMGVPELNIASPAVSLPASSPLLTAAPTTSWLTKVGNVWSNAAQGLWGGVTTTVAKASEKLPDVLWNWVGQRVGLIPRAQDQGGGQTIIYSQPAVSGGLPAQAQALPGQGTNVSIATPQAAALGTGTILIIGLAILAYVLLGKVHR